MPRVRTNDLERKVNTLSSKQKHRIYFDLEAPYTVCYISRLFGVSQRMALRYVQHNGMLTEKGIQALHDINEAFCQDSGD